MSERLLEKIEVVDIGNLEPDSEGFDKLRTVLRSGKAVRNPFTKSLVQDVVIPVNKELVLEFEKISKEKGIPVSRLYNHCFHRYIQEVKETPGLYDELK